MDTRIEWIGPKALISLIQEHRSEWVELHPEVWLLPALREGLINARARRARIERARVGREELIEDWVVDPNVWEFEADRTDLDLLMNRFTSTARHTGYASVILAGISFNKAEFLEFAEICVPDQSLRDDANAVPQNLKDKGGAPADAEKWANLAAVVGAIFANSDLVPGSGPPTRAKMQKQIEHYADLIGLPLGTRNTIKGAIDLVIKLAWADHDDDGRPLVAADGTPLNPVSNPSG